MTAPYLCLAMLFHRLFPPIPPCPMPVQSMRACQSARGRCSIHSMMPAHWLQCPDSAPQGARQLAPAAIPTGCHGTPSHPFSTPAKACSDALTQLQAPLIAVKEPRLHRLETRTSPCNSHFSKSATSLRRLGLAFPKELPGKNACCAVAQLAAALISTNSYPAAVLPQRLRAPKLSSRPTGGQPTLHLTLHCSPPGFLLSTTTLPSPLFILSAPVLFLSLILFPARERHRIPPRFVSFTLSSG